MRSLAMVALLLGCYNPRIGDRLRCAADAGASSCPSGFVCDGVYCRGAGYDRTADLNDGGADADTADVGTTPRQVLEFCTIFRRGLPTQTDDCAPGLVCMQDGCDDRCYKRCGSDVDCDNASCTRAAAGGGLVCDVPFVDCNPVGATSGCAASVVACYLSAARPTRTICDCPFGAGGANTDCTSSRDCVRGLACADPGTGRALCLQVCLLANDGSDCPGGTTGSCRPYRGAPVSAPNSTYGFCF